MVSVAFGQDSPMEKSSSQKCRSEFLKRSGCQEREMQMSREVYFELINNSHSNNQAFNLIKLSWRLGFFQCAVIFGLIFVVVFGY